MSKKKGKKQNDSDQMTLGMIIDFMDKLEKMGKKKFIMQQRGTKYLTEYILYKKRTPIINE